MGGSSDFDDWTSGPGHKNLCQTCTNYPGLLDTILEFVRLRDSKKTQRSFRDFHREWLVPRGYELSEGGLMKHIRKCLPGSDPNGE